MNKYGYIDRDRMVCKDCGVVATRRQWIYDLECLCGGSGGWVERPDPEPAPEPEPDPDPAPESTLVVRAKCTCPHAPGGCGRTCDEQARCPYCYNNGNGCPVLFHGAVDEPYRRAREILVADASQRGRPRQYTARDNRLPEEISPWAGLEPGMAKEMAELFPAPNPDIVASRRLRKIAGWGKKVDKTVGIVIPREILYVTGMRLGDLVLISGWCSGVIRIVRIPEGENG
jgi:hypothetical protein